MFSVPTPSNVTVTLPPEGWPDFYDGSWTALHRAFRDRHAATPFANAFQAVRYLEKTFELIDKSQVGDVMPGGRRLLRTSSFRGQTCVIPAYANVYAGEILADLVAGMGPFDAVVELGCGYGRNLFDCFYFGGWSGPYFGGELTEGGRAFASELIGLATGMQASFHPFTHLAPDLTFVGRPKRALITTVHSIEAVEAIPEDYFDRLADGAEQVVGVHIEPVGFQYGSLGEVSDIHRQLATTLRWNLNFRDSLQAAINRGRIAVSMIAPEVLFPSDALNPSTIIIWTSR
jgi:hypothetical protein